MLLADLVDVSSRVASTRARLTKIETLAATLGSLTPAEAPIAVSYLAGRPRQDRLGVGPAAVYGVEVSPAEKATLQVLEVDRLLDEIASQAGPGSKIQRLELLTMMLGRATESEQEFLRGLMLRNLRQGALEGVMAEAVAATLGVDPALVRRAAMLEGDLVTVAARALAQGPGALGSARLAVLTPVQPMLAGTAASAAEALAGFGTAVVEEKLDGARVQVHRKGDRVAIYTRSLREITDQVPEIVVSALALDADTFILDGEALLFGPGGEPEQFQDSMSRFGSEGLEGRPQLVVLYFDCLHLNGADLIDAPLSERRTALAGLVPPEHMVRSVVTDDASRAEEFFDQAVRAGFEGVVVKAPNRAYEAGRRGSSWLKVKPSHTLDLVVLAAEWGSGRRQGWLSNLHLGALGKDGEMVMLGKTFKGLTDEMLEWQTSRFLEIEDHREGHIVYLKPEIVYEIAFDGVQRSSRYPGGVTLRFARVKRYREDKTPAEADTLDAVRGLLR